MGQVTVFSGPERRRRWSDEERLQIVAEAFAPGARVADVCRRHDVSSGDCQDFRVWAGIMGKKESHYVPTQRTCDPV